MKRSIFRVIKHEGLIASCFLLWGIALRIYQFPNVPPGLNQDEAAIAYEAYSLLLTGADRWGNSFPVYFSAWGSGQNVLYAYLSIPIVWLFGLNSFSARAVNLLFGILLLPLQYVCTRHMYGRTIALAATGLTAILPWHVMLSRWGLEANLFPFFLLLGTYTVSLAITDHSRKVIRIFALIPWAISFYAYGVALIILPTLLLLVALSYRKDILKKRGQWLTALLLFLLIVFPWITFAVKNNLLHRNLGFEKFLPFSIPLLPSQRLAQVSGGNLVERLSTNIQFLLGGFQDGLIWNSIPEFPPLLMIAFPFLGIGFLALIRQFLLTKKADLFLLWLISCIPLFLLIQLNVNRANAIFIPVIGVSALGFFELFNAMDLAPSIGTLKNQGGVGASPPVRSGTPAPRSNANHYGYISLTSFTYLKRTLALSVAGWLLVSSLYFSNYYFQKYPDVISHAFNAGLEKALNKTVELSAAQEKILISQQLSKSLPYIYILFYFKQDPRIFQTDSDYRVTEKGVFEVRRFDRFYFKQEWLSLQPAETFVYLIKKGDRPPCKNSNLLYKDREWQVGRCS